MRICYIAHSRSHFTRPYVDYFARQGHEVHLVSLLGPGLPNAVNHPPLRREPGPWVRHVAYLRALPTIRRIVRSLRPCLLHAHYLSSNGVCAAFSGGHPLVVSVRGSDLRGAWNPVRSAMLRYALARADIVNPVSRAFEGPLRSLGVPSAKMLILTQGVESRRFTAARPVHRTGPVRIVCTRDLRSVCNGARIVDALAILQERGVPFMFTFAAGGPQEPSLRRAAKRHGLGERVRFLGGYEQEELPAILEAADIYVSATLSDGASVSLLEAMSSGAFPVVSDIPGNREWLSGAGDALLFDPRDPAALARCLVHAMQDPELRRKAALINRVTIETRAERVTNLERLAGVYRDLWGRLTARARPALEATPGGSGPTCGDRP